MKRTKFLSALIALTFLILPPHWTAQATGLTTGSITIHKYEVSNLSGFNLNNTGEEKPDDTIVAGTTKLSDLAPIQGIEFKITLVEAKGTAILGSINPDDYDPVSGADAFADTRTTDSNGLIEWENLKLGLYKIEEQLSSKVESTIPGFIVQLPMPNPTSYGFIYDVHIYPKNLTASPGVEKEMVPPAANEGSNVLTWHISVDVAPDIEEAQELIVTDDLDPRLQFVTGSDRAYYTDKAGTKNDLARVVHYTVSYDTSAGKNQLKFEMTAAGFTEAAGALSGSGSNLPKLHFEFGTLIVLSGPPTDEPIENDADLDFTNSAGNKYSTKNVPEPPETYPYGIEIIKEENITGTRLANAKFKIYSSQANAVAKTKALKDPQDPSKDWEITTGGDGKATFYGLSYGAYWIVETQAPAAGYNLLPAPASVVIPNTDKEAAPTQIIIQTIVNNKGFILPVTGGSGVVTMTVTGLALMGVAMVFLMLSMKKSKKTKHSEECHWSERTD